MAAKDVKEEKSEEEVITAVYKVNLHCKQCAREIRQPLLRAQGVHKVECDIESGKITIKGSIDAVKIHKRIEKLSKKKVELVSPKPKVTQEVATTTEKKIIVKETVKEMVVRKTTVKVHMHCEKCEQDIRRMLLKHKGIYTVKTDFKAQTLMVEGSIESDRLVSHIRNKIHKKAEIVKPKEEEKAEEETQEKAKGEFKDQEKVGVKDEKGNIPYFVHYVYAPQTFSDENPHACSIM
uniref:HMA domain-containing protein n=1 Tax=Kalanchoe fedtschenkoi TaxID=63787 RepID=A0A7N0V5C5_KALFE